MNNVETWHARESSVGRIDRSASRSRSASRRAEGKAKRPGRPLRRWQEKEGA